MIVQFQEVTIKATRRWVDETGKRRQQTRSFSQTVNPWNRNSKGVMKSRREIMVELTDARDAWLAEPRP